MPSTQPDDRTAVPRTQSLAALWADMQPHALCTGLPGVPSGMPSLDRLTGGWRPGTLTVVAGRPGMGVTSFLLTAMRNAAVDFNIPVLYCAPTEQMAYAVQRLVLGEAGHEATDLRTTGLSSYERASLPALVAPLLSSSFHVLALEAPDCPAVLHAVQAATPAPGIVVFDYRTILSPKGANCSFAVRQYLHEMRELSQTLALPVLLSCGVAAAADFIGGYSHNKLQFLPHPDLLTQYVDLVLFLYRADYYGIGEDADDHPTAGQAAVQVVYQRQGPTLDWIPLRFNGRTGRFSNLEGNH